MSGNPSCEDLPKVYRTIVSSALSLCKSFVKNGRGRGGRAARFFVSCRKSTENRFTRTPFCGIMNYTGTPAGGAHTERKENMERKNKKVFFVLAIICICSLLAFVACTDENENDEIGNAFYASKDSSVVFYLDYQDGACLNTVHINIGTVQAEPGESYSITTRTASATNTSDSPWSSSYGSGEKTFTVDEETEKWVQVRDESNASQITSTRRLVQFTFSCDMYINEIAFLDTNGNVIPAYLDYDTVHGFFNANSVYQWDTFGTAFRTQRDYEGLANLVDSNNNQAAIAAVNADKEQDANPFN